jgi:hypothetical protein
MWRVLPLAVAVTVSVLAAQTAAPLPTVPHPHLAQVPPARPQMFMAQERHDKHKDDADAFCFNPETSGSQADARRRDRHAHACKCHLTCQVGAAGEVTGDSESTDCELYCTRERCACHVESPCEMPS